MIKLKKTQIVMKLRNSICDETQKLKLYWNLKTQIVTKLKNSNFDETKNSNVDETKNSYRDETQKLKLC